MPLPMVHLATAREYACNIPSLISCPDFYLGCISPDAIHIRENTDKSDKWITHLRADGELWKDNIITFLKQNKTKYNYNFLLGYGIHNLTDYVWNGTLYRKYRSSYEEDHAPVQDRKWAYYNDTDQLDFILYRTCEWRQDVWRLLEKAKETGVPGILNPDEVDAWRNHTLHWFDSGESQHKNPIRYISFEELIEFIRNAGQKIKDILVSEGL